MARLNYNATVDELEIMAGSCTTVANVAYDDGDGMKAAFFFGAASGIDQLLKLGDAEGAHHRVMVDWNQMEGRLKDGR